MNEPVLYYVLIGVAAGTLGSMVGLGGGIIMVPALTILLGVDIKNAISASLISLVATSVMSVSVYAKKQLVHYRMGLIFEFTTVLGSFAGSYAGVYLDRQILTALFASLLLVAAFVLFRNLRNPPEERLQPYRAPQEGEGFFTISGTYRSEISGDTSTFAVKRVPLIFSLSTFAGAVSGMLGVGGGIIKVPMMHLIGGVPIKVATATSGFMIGITGLAGSIVYFVHDQFDVAMTSALIVGITVGSYMGSKIALKVHSKFLIILLLIVLIYTSFRMFAKVV